MPPLSFSGGSDASSIAYGDRVDRSPSMFCRDRVRALHGRGPEAGADDWVGFCALKAAQGYGASSCITPT